MKKPLLIILTVLLLCSCSSTDEMVAHQNGFLPPDYAYEREELHLSSESINEESKESQTNIGTDNDAIQVEIEAIANSLSEQEYNRYLSEYLNAESAEWLETNGFEVDTDLFLLIDTQTSSFWDDLLEETIYDTFYLFFCYYVDYTHGSWNSFLLVESETKSEIKQLPQMLDYCIFGMTMYIHDVDGDGREEVIIHQDVDMFGGAGQYRTMVFKITDNELKELFKSPTDGGLFDTGFRSSFLDGCNFQINNIYTGYSETFDFRNYDSKESFWDEKGHPYDWDDWDGWDGSWLWVDSFCYLNPIDIDNDGVFEIACEQYSCLIDHSDYIGEAKSILKYNAETQVFEVVDAEFFLYYGLDMKYNRNISRLEDLNNPELIEQGAHYKVYFEKPYRYCYLINDNNDNIVKEGGSFGARPRGEYVSDSILVIRNIDGSYDNEMYFDTETNGLSEVFRKTVYQNDELVVYRNDDSYEYTIQHLFETKRQIIPGMQLPGISSLMYPFVDIRITENGSKLEITYITGVTWSEVKNKNEHVTATVIIDKKF